MRWLDVIIDSMDMNLGKLWETVTDRQPLYAPVCGSQRVRQTATTTSFVRLYFENLAKLRRVFRKSPSYIVQVEVTQLCPTLCDPMDYPVHGILQARILEWVAFPFSGGSYQPRDRTHISHIAGRFFTGWATREAQVLG